MTAPTPTTAAPTTSRSAPMPIASARGRATAATHPCPHVADLVYSLYNAVRGVPRPPSSARSDRRSPSPGLATSPPSRSVSLSSSLSSSPTTPSSEVFKALGSSSGRP